MRAAGMPLIITFVEPIAITSGGPTQVHMSPTRAAGRPAIRTVTAPGGRIGPPTCGTTPVTIGQVCMSDTRAAGGMGGADRRTAPERRSRAARAAERAERGLQDAERAVGAPRAEVDRQERRGDRDLAEHGTECPPRAHR